MDAIRKGFGRLPKLAQDVLIGLAFTGAGVVAAALLIRIFGDTRLGMIFLLPVLFTGLMAGTRAALISAAVSFSIFNFFLTEPLYSLQIATTEDGVTLLTFVLVAVVIGVASGAQRDEHARAVSRARILQAISDTNRFFQSTSDETAVRAKLASAISDLVGTGAAVTGADGRLEFFAGRSRPGWPASP
jgi:two-component system, OmpR family, sensor histidine kinase KdpD